MAHSRTIPTLLPRRLLAANWLEPEPLHAVENIDETVFRALRVELKGGLAP